MAVSTATTGLELLRSLQSEIDVRMADYFAGDEFQLDTALTPNGEYARGLLEEFSLRPCKRLRGALVILAYEMFGGTNRQTALDAAVAMELAQNYLLIVDDVMDRSATRRGGETMQLKYKALIAHKYPGLDLDHTGNMLGINTGLIAQHMAARLLGRVHEDPARVLKALDLFHKNIATTGYGQLDDLFNDATALLSAEEIIHLCELKTSYYTFINTLQTGAVLAGATDADLAAFHKFGLHAGLAFQLQDDIIGMFGSEKISGKSALDDLREGKVTLLMEHALTHVGEQDLTTLRAALGNAELTSDQHNQVKRILEAAGSRQYVSELAHAESTAARQVLDTQTDWDRTAVDLLAELLQYIVERNI